MRAVALLVLLAAAAEARAIGCSFGAGPKPLGRDAAESGIVLYCVAGPGGNPDATAYRIVRALKTHACIAGQDVIELPHQFKPLGPNDPPGILLFATVKDDLAVYDRGEPATPALADYLAGLMKLNPAERGRALRYAFDHLESDDKAVAAEAHAEFTASADADVAKASKHFPAETLRGWLKRDADPGRRAGRYALLLAGCGTAADAPLVRGLIDKAIPDQSTSLDHMLAAYTVLDPKAGWPFVKELAAKPDGPFIARYATLKAIRYLKETRSEVVPLADLVAALGLLMQPDFADLPLEDLRKWKRWDLNDQVFGLIGRKGFEAKIVDRAILRYALQCPDPRAAAHVAVMRAANPDRVAVFEEALKDEEAEAAKKAKAAAAPPGKLGLR